MNSDYQERIDKVISYIDDYFSEKIDLAKLAEISNFSKYHFSRIFAGIVGVPPIEFVNRKRLQKAILHLRDRSKSILEISKICGFESLSSFNALLKKYYGYTPSEVRKEISNNPSVFSKMNEDFKNPPWYNHQARSNFIRRIWDMNILIMELELPEYEVAYVRKVGSYLETGEAWKKLTRWAQKNGLYPPQSHFIGISLDDPSEVEEFACRYDACVTLPAGFKKESDPEVKFRKIPGGLYALYQFYDIPNKLAIAYQSIFGNWLPNSEYNADDRHCLEFCMNDPCEDPEGKCKVDLYIPIKKRA